MSTATLRCGCGEVQGEVVNATPQTVNRVVCYCDDCQAFAHHLGRADLLDSLGGSDIIQVAPAALRFQTGQGRIAGLRLSPKGLYRWYADCCNTPLGNTVSPRVPFVGCVAQVFDHGTQRTDDAFGKPTGAILGQYAIGEAPQGSRGMPTGVVARALFRVVGWRLRGLAWPNPFFEKGKTSPIYPVRVLTSSEREALRPLCGPQPQGRRMASESPS